MATNVAIVLGGAEDVLAEHVHHDCCARVDRCGGSQAAHDSGDGIEQAGVLAWKPRSISASHGAFILAREARNHDDRASWPCRVNDGLQVLVSQVLEVADL